MGDTQRSGHLKQGYLEGVPYLKLVFNMLSPAHLAFCLSLAGRSAPDTGKPFTYVDLGSGFGISTVGWAAQFPHATFYAVDYDEMQIQWTRKLADDAGIDNLITRGCSVSELVDADLPSFDFIVLHGLYSWVNDAVRADVDAFIKRFLKPGGCVYISYNAMPGGKDVEPMRHLVEERIRCTGNDETVFEAIQAALERLAVLRADGAGFFSGNRDAAARLDSWLTADPRYLAAELAGDSHKVFYFSELAGRLSRIGLEWGASADIVHRLSPVAVCGRGGENALFSETVRDMTYLLAFRTDIFVQVDAQAVGESSVERLRATRFCLAQTRKPLPAEASKGSFSAVLTKPVYRILQAALGVAPLSPAELEARTGLPQDEVVEALCVLTALDWVHASPPQDDSRIAERCRRLNAALYAMQDGQKLLPLFSARGGWVELSDQLLNLCVLSRLLGRPTEALPMDVLLSGNDDEEFLRTEQILRAYVQREEASMEDFLNRHGFGACCAGPAG